MRFDSLFSRPFRVAFIALALVAWTLPASAQSTRNYGTTYSQYGLGERLSFASSQAEMMGGASVGVRSYTYNNLDNPALWSDLNLTQFSVAAQIEGVEAENASGDQSRLSSGTLSALQLGIPLIPGKLGLTAAFRPFSRVNYRAERAGELIEPGLTNPIPYTLSYEGGGGLQQFRLGLGYRFNSSLSVGASVDALFGTIDDLRRTTFESTLIAESRITRSTELAGASGTVGALFSTTGLLGEEDALSIGAALSLPTRLTGDRVRTAGFSLDQDTLAAPRGGDVTVPLQAVAGVSYVPNTRWIFAADVRYEPWSQFESDFAFGGFDGAAGVDQLRDRVRVGGGFQVLPAGTDRSKPYLARTAYRLGGYVDRAYFDATPFTAATIATPGEAITTLALTGGLSLPALLPTARFDLGFEVGTRGTTDGGLVRDLFIKGSATINFGERWFRQRKLG